MVRVFSHYVSAKLMLLVVLEALVLMLSVRLGLAFHLSGSGAAIAQAVVPPPVMAFSLGMLIVMNSMGLYQPDLWKEEQSVRVRLVAAVLLGLSPGIFQDQREAAI
jgi:hypothetical protein